MGHENIVNEVTKDVGGKKVGARAHGWGQRMVVHISQRNYVGLWTGLKSVKDLIRQFMNWITGGSPSVLVELLADGDVHVVVDVCVGRA